VGMNALDFIAAGVVIEPKKGGGFRIEGPPERKDLLEELRFEVATRLELVGDEARLPQGNPRAYCCDLCGDPIGHDRRGECVLCPKGLCRRQYSGLCLLCSLARDKKIREAQSRREIASVLTVVEPTERP
jgi:hypothetical protein